MHDFRYSTRKVSDTVRMRRLIDQTVGRRLTYRPLMDGRQLSHLKRHAIRSKPALRI
jgi:hypothetical protein